MNEKDNAENIRAIQSDKHRREVEQRRAQDEKKKQTPWYVEIPMVIVLTLIFMALVQGLVGRVYVIPSQSMEPTLHGCAGCTGDRIFVEKLSYYFSDPEPGDVIVFEGTESWNQNYVSQRSENPVLRGLQTVGAFAGLVVPDENILVKRVIATGGQTVQCLPGDAGITVDGAVVDSHFIEQPSQYPVNPANGSEACGGDYFGPITVPDRHLFMMGDNRTNSADSRYHLNDGLSGTIPVDNVRGKVEVIVYPFSRIGFIEDFDIQSTPAQ